MNDDPDPKEPNPSIEEIKVPLPDPPTMAEGEEVPSALSERETILKLHEQGYGMRKIAVAMGRDRKTVRRVLKEEGKDPQHPNPQSADLPRLPVRQSKLDSFRGSIRQKAEAHLTISRILREIQEDGYTGGRTVLAEYVRSLNLTSPPPAAKRRFETGIGEETQVDWSVYTVPIAGTPRRVHALLCVLAYSRYIHVGFYRDERQATLFEGLARAFDAFSGVTQRVVFDNMSTAVLARIGKDRKPLWHPRLLDFARHYGFQPFACRVRDPNRKGKDERIFLFLETDFVRASSFSSFEDLQERAQNWASTIANRRIHGTTRRIPEEAWLSERDFLVKLPDTRFAVHEESVRQVGPDATISIRGTLFTIPHTLANQSVAVRLFAEHFEVLNRQSQVVLSRAYVPDEEKGTLQIDPTHYLTLSGPRGGGSPRFEETVLQRFPSLAPLVDGIRARMKSLAHVHLRALLRLADRYGDPPFLVAATRAQDYRRYNAEAVRRILERDNPLPESAPAPKDSATRAKVLLGEVDPGSLDQYAHLDKTNGGSESQDNTTSLPCPEEDHHEEK